MQRLSRRIETVLLLIVGVAVLGSVLAAQAHRPVIGKWILNVAKSKFEPGPAPMSMTSTYEDQGNGLIVATREGVGARGSRQSVQYSAKYDGTDYPYPVGQNQTIAFTVVDARTTTFVIKANGQVINEGTQTVSADGSTLTIVEKGTTPQGQATSATRVYERQ